MIRKNKLSMPANIILLVCFAVVGIIFMLPLLWMLFSSLKTEAAIMGAPGVFFPDDYTLENFHILLTQIPFFRFLVNSFIFAGGVTLSSLLLDSLDGNFSNFHIRFLLELCIMLGFSPDMDDIAPFTGDKTCIMENFLKMSFEEAMLIPLTGNVRNELAESVLRYIEYHNESSVNIRSLKVLRELFR